MLFRSALVIAGVVLYARADAEEERPGDPIDGDEWTVTSIGEGR